MAKSAVAGDAAAGVLMLHRTATQTWSKRRTKRRVSGLFGIAGDPPTLSAMLNSGFGVFYAAAAISFVLEHLVLTGLPRACLRAPQCFARNHLAPSYIVEPDVEARQVFAQAVGVVAAFLFQP